ncbi:hypothetical protein CRM22_006855 [Opisthorchis felineus]|uniref:UBX domain-containing protein n=2 Tax=Opisthorchis felineus TaxID=147828 RepID=A0A4S2LJ48_OPIFE|nr:hypothetical protein CRM22_006855 [Opisthorchis felineus]
MSSDLVECFRQVTGADTETAASFLSACNNNLEMAVSLYMDEGTVTPTTSAEEYRSPIPQRTEQLLPVELPIYASRFARPVAGTATSTLYRARRRAFVADDSDDDNQDVSSLPVASAVSNEQEVSDTFRVHHCNSSSTIPNHSPGLGHFSASPGTVHSTVNGSHESIGKKRSHLRQLYQPPVEIMFDGSLSEAKSSAQERNQWLLISLHDESCFDCHLMNRDVWKDPRVYQTVKKNFTFLQIPVDSPEGFRFRSRYSYVTSASHIAVLDPTTGEQKVMWMHLKDPNTVNEVLTEFLRHNKTTVPSGSSVSGSRRPAETDTDPCVTTLYPLKRPRTEQSVGDSSGLLSRVAAVSSQIDDKGSNSMGSQPSCSRSSPLSRIDTTNNPLDLTEEEQLQLAIEASKAETTVSSRLPSSKSRTKCSDVDRSAPWAASDADDELIVLTDDETDSSVEEDNRDPECFIYDPDTSRTASVSTTAMISGRRPLRPTSGSCPVPSTVSMSTASPAPEPSTSHSTLLPLPVPGPNEDVMELVVRLPSGEREVLRISPNLQLQVLRRHFNSRGFPHSRYEFVRLYPRTSLSTLPDTTRLNEAGLSKKDTVFLQEI